MVEGHEFAGEIVSTGSNVSGFKIGDIVTTQGHVVCGLCSNCFAARRHLCKETSGLGVSRPSAFAEFISVPMTNVWLHAPDVDQDIASIYDPFGNAVQTALFRPDHEAAPT
jgi:threonine 3-dehydrogenase